MKKKSTPPNPKKEVKKADKKAPKAKPSPYGNKRHKGKRVKKESTDLDIDTNIDFTEGDFDLLGEQPEF